MTGIAGAVRDYAGPAVCPQCGINEGDRKPDGKRLLCLPIAQAVSGVGVMCWCSEDCRIVWLATQPLETDGGH